MFVVRTTPQSLSRLFCEPPCWPWFMYQDLTMKKTEPKKTPRPRSASARCFQFGLPSSALCYNDALICYYVYMSAVGGVDRWVIILCHLELFLKFQPHVRPGHYARK
jgi:hypothetical protein